VESAQGSIQSGWESSYPYDAQCQSSTSEVSLRFYARVMFVTASWLSGGDFLFSRVEPIAN
jgi:hypothetical protein